MWIFMKRPWKLQQPCQLTAGNLYYLAKLFMSFLPLLTCHCKKFLFHLHKEWEYKPCTLICVHSAGRWALRNTWFVSPLFCIHTVSFFLPPRSTFPKSVSVDTWMPFLFFCRSSRNVDLRGPEKAETLKQDKVHSGKSLLKCTCNNILDGEWGWGWVLGLISYNAFQD